MPTEKLSNKYLYELAKEAGGSLRAHHTKLVTAESCTGGWIAKVVTDIPGSSEWFDHGLVTYSNTAKIDLLGVKEATINKYGAVSNEVVIEMATGIMKRSAAGVAIAVSGIAGNGDSAIDRPVGTVYLAWILHNSQLLTECHHFNGGRAEVRIQTVAAALEGMLSALKP
jgi:nicotinamide-nucleotide amidase